DDDSVTFASIVEAAGNIPIPPYLNRESEEGDRDDYQTVYSRVKGSVAAPTAGLHFTTPLLERLADTGVEIEKVTLHVGAGTFKPVKSATIGDHPMHTESVSVPLHVIESLITAIETGRPVLAVGTTSVRTLESLPYFGRLARTRDVSDRGEMHIDQWMAYEDRDEDTLTLLRTLRDAMKSHGEETLNGSTQIMIAPGFGWRVVDMMVTNFHQPQSTLLLLVSSFLEPDSDKPQVWRRAYDAALDADYRFLSYGDACLFYRM
ncbi:MAG: S-adenosylmethionine:tRNA ribosyltransferase-isomerase, partial [Muribaculaceae bacterium]|nr:S-adenosylmethionine:tRNA ribosyltransferase-isomerase [Muribaculaceae bacterium]